MLLPEQHIRNKKLCCVANHAQKIIHLYGNTTYCIRQQNTVLRTLYLAILSFFKYAYYFYFAVISTFIRKISKESYIEIYYKK